jgi:acetyl-CoA acetyltransferase
MADAFVCDAVRTPIGRYGGALSSIRADDLGAIPIAALIDRNVELDPAAIDDLAYGCANQAGEDNRNVARMSLLLAGLPVAVPAVTINRLCGSGMNAVGNVADAIRAGSINVAIAGGVESMSRVVAWAVAGVEPRIMGIGPAPASEKVLALAGLTIKQMDVIELNEAFAAQGLATLRRLGIADDAEHVNPNGGAIAPGNPLGMSGARLVTTAAYQLRRTGGKYALCSMCIGVGQGIAMIIESV